jgi:hypothetical protein
LSAEHCASGRQGRLSYRNSVVAREPSRFSKVVPPPNVLIAHSKQQGSHRAMKIDREARVKGRLRSALDHVQSYMRSGGDADHPLAQLEVADRELRKMLAALENGALNRHQPSGLWHMITDSWPLRDALGEEIVAAEFEFDRLSKSPRQR